MIRERAEVFAAALRRDLERCAKIHAITARELAAARGVAWSGKWPSERPL